MAELKMGADIRMCKGCERQSIGAYIYGLFDSNQENISLLLGFDKDTKEILINEELLMNIIQMANPAQSPRKIKLVQGGVNALYKI